MNSTHEIYSSFNDENAKSVPGNSTLQPSSQSLSDKDQPELARSGKKQVLKRNFGLVSMTGFTCGLMATWEGILTLFELGLVNGGSAGLIYGFLLCWAGNMSVFAVIGELSSIAPTAGGQYHWVSILAPPPIKRFLSHITGWWTIIGWITTVTLQSLFCSGVIQNVALLNYPTYQPTAWQNTLIFEAAILFAFLGNVFMARTLPVLEIGVLILHVVGFAAIIIPLIYLTSRNNSRTLFTTFSTNGGWNSKSLSFFIGLNGNAAAFIGTDGPVHMSEEVKKTHNKPFGMLPAVLLAAGDPSSYDESPFPFIPIFANTFQSAHAATGASCILIVFILSILVGSMACASRVIWSFSRDRGLPGWKTLSQVNTRITRPLAALVTVTISCALLGLINIGSSLALNDVISLTVQALLSTYLVSCTLLLFRRLRGDIGEFGSETTSASLSYTWGPWRIPGMYGTLNNFAACLHLIIILFFSFWPTATPVSVKTMNYSILGFLSASIIAIVYYVVWARKTYKAPIFEISL